MANMLALIKKRSILSQVFEDPRQSHFWRQTFLPKWLPLLLGAGLGILIAALIADRVWYLAILLSFGVPLIALFLRYPFAVIILWVAVLPYFVATPTMVERYIFWVLYRGMVPLVLITVILAYFMGLARRRSAKLGRAELSMFIFLGLTLLNIYLVGDQGSRDLIKLYDQIIAPFCIYWLVRLLAPNQRDLKRLLLAALATLVFQCVIGLLSWFAPDVLPPQWLGLQGERTVGTLRNVAVYTSMLIFLALLLFHYGMQCKSKRLKWLLIVVFGFAYFCIFFSFSRGSWLGGGIVLLGLLVMYPRMVLGVIIVVTAITITLGNSVLASEMAWAWERFNNEDTANSRIIQNMASYRMIAAKPLTGWGYDDYNTYSIGFKTRVGDIPLTGTKSTSHNTYLTLMAELGLPTFLFYFFPVIWSLILTPKAWRNLPKNGFWSRRLLILLWLVILHIFIVTNFMDMIRFHPFGTCLWWMTLALISTVIHSALGSDATNVPQWALQPARTMSVPFLCKSK